VAGSWPSTLRRSHEAPTARRRCAAAPAVIQYAYVVENLERSIDNHVERLGVGRYGFHHRAVTTDRFDEDLARYSRMGYDEAFSDVLPSGAPSSTPTRDATCRAVELVEHTKAQERHYTDIYRAAVDWDGRDPMRRDGYVNR